MSAFRDKKRELLKLLPSENWQKAVQVNNADEAISYLSPLLAMLPRSELRWRAAHCLGVAVAVLAAERKEDARNFMRRLMWSLNEESGNMGWGIPEAMASIIAANPELGAEYERILMSYITISGKGDNFIDHAPLRLGVYWGIGYIARNRSAALWQALPLLIKSLDEEELACQGMAAWALAQLASWYFEHDEKIMPKEKEIWTETLKKLKELELRFEGKNSFAENPSLEIFEDLEIKELSCHEVVSFAREAVEKVIRAA